MRKTYKKVIALCSVLIFALALIPVQSFALGDPFTAVAVGGLSGASGTGLFGSMAGASGVSIGFSNVSVDQTDALWNGLNPDSVYFSGSKGQKTVVDPQTEIPTVYDYIQVDLADWLQAQTEFIDEFVTNYNVTDNDTETVSKSASVFGVPVTQNGQNYDSADLGILNYNSNPSISIGPFLLQYDGQYSLKSYFQGSVVTDSAPVGFERGQVYLRYSPGGSSIFWKNKYNGNQNINALPSGATIQFSSPYSFTWVSTEVNTDVFDDFEAPTIMIPANSWSPSDPMNWGVDEFLEALSDLYIGGQSSVIVIEDDDPGPVPPPPVPSTPLGEVPYDEWYDDMGDLIGQGVSEGLGDIESDLHETKEEVETQTGILQNILSGVQDLVQEIVLSTETFIAGLLNSIMGGLGGMFSTMREAFSIWHYVVEWVGSISTVFSWFWSVAGNTSYYIQLPIYASLAGAVVLAFYKRFGK